MRELALRALLADAGLEVCAQNLSSVAALWNHTQRTVLGSEVSVPPHLQSPPNSPVPNGTFCGWIEPASSWVSIFFRWSAASFAFLRSSASLTLAAWGQRCLRGRSALTSALFLPPSACCLFTCCTNFCTLDDLFLFFRPKAGCQRRTHVCSYSCRRPCWPAF